MFIKDLVLLAFTWFFVIFLSYVVSGFLMSFTLLVFYIVGFFDDGSGVGLMVVKFSFLLFVLLFSSSFVLKRKWLVGSRVISWSVFLFFFVSVVFDVCRSGIGWRDVYSASWAGIFVLLALLKMLAVFWVSIGYFKMVNVLSVFAGKLISVFQSARCGGL